MYCTTDAFRTGRSRHRIPYRVKGSFGIIMKYSYRHLLTAMVVLWALLLVEASAQVTSRTILEPDSITTDKVLDEFVVTGSGTLHHSSTAPVRTELLTGKSIEAIAAPSLTDILTRLSPSFDSNKSAMGSGLTLGGLGNSYILILVNGKRLHGDVGGQNDLAKIDPQQIRKIEIVKGAASTLYGTDAIAGVINIITKDYNPRTLSVYNTTRIGSYGELKQSNTLSFRLGDFTSVTRYAHQKSDGWQNTRMELYRDRMYDNSTTMTSSAYFNHRISEELTWRPNLMWKVTGSGSWYMKRIYHEPGEPRLNMYNLRYNDADAALGATFTPSSGQTYSLDFSWAKHGYYYEYYLRYLDEIMREELLDDGKIHYVPDYFWHEPGSSSLESDQQQYILHAKAVNKLPKHNLLSTGIETIVDYLYAPSRMVKPSAVSYTLAAYAQDEWTPIDAVQVTGGLRYVYHDSFGSNLTPKISVRYRPWKPLLLNAAFATGFKAPTNKELFYEYERPMMGKLRLYLGNPDLKPQTSYYTSLSATYTPIKDLTLDVSYSYNDVRNMIQLIPVKMPDKFNSDEGSSFDAAMQYTNGESARIHEVEATLTYKPWRGANLSLGYVFSDTWTRVYDAKKSSKKGTVIIDERPIDGSARHKGTINFAQDFDFDNYKLTAALYSRMQTDRYYFYYGRAAGYALWGLNTVHKFTLPYHLTATLTAGVDNLFDYKETHPYGYNYGTYTPGRTYFVSLNIGLKEIK